MEADSDRTPEGAQIKPEPSSCPSGSAGVTARGSERRLGPEHAKLHENSR